MTEAWQVWLLVLSILLGIYLLFAIYVVQRLYHYSSSMAQRLKAINVILAEKKEILLTMLVLYDEEGIHLDTAESKAAEKVRWLKIETKDVQQVIEIVETFDVLQKRLSYLAENDGHIKENRSYQIHKSALDDLDGNYRRIVALFDHDLALYKYWKKNLLYRHIFEVLPLTEWQRLP